MDARITLNNAYILEGELKTGTVKMAEIKDLGFDLCQGKVKPRQGPKDENKMHRFPRCLILNIFKSRTFNAVESIDPSSL